MEEKIFVASLKMLVVPLVFVSLVCGTSSLKDLSTLGMGGKTLAFYIATTAIAISLALLMGFFFNLVHVDLTAASSFQSEAPSLGQVTAGMFPINLINARQRENTSSNCFYGSIWYCHQCRW